MLAVVSLAACAPRIDGPTAQQRAHDAEDGARLGAQLAALPGVVTAEVLLRRVTRDPLSTDAPVPAALSLVVIVDDRADRVAIGDRAKQLAAAVAPDLAPTIVVEVGAVRPQLTSVGPFVVEARSRGLLRAVLGIALALLAACAGAIAWSELRALRRWQLTR